MGETIYVHIGPHKTGTTSIQHALLVNQDILKKRGVLCPQTGRPWHNSAATHNLAWQLRNPNGVRFKKNDGTWDELLEEIRTTRRIDKVLLSSEDFCLLRLEQFQAMGEHLRDYDTKIILYLRRQDQALQSLWAEFVRNNNTPGDIECFYDWLENNNYSYPSFDYLSIVNKLETVFSRENVILRIFDPSDFKENLFFDFLDLCGIKYKGCQIPPNANVSSGVKTIEAIRLVKSRIEFKTLDKEIWSYLVRSIDQYGNRIGWNDVKMNYLDEGLSETIMQHHQAANDIIAQQYYQREHLFPIRAAKKKATTTFLYDDFTKDELVDLFSFLLKKLSVRVPKK